MNKSSLIILGFLVNLFADQLQITDFTQVTSCDYLVICPDSFISCGVKLAAYRNRYQFDDVENARAVSLTTITQKFPVEDSLPRAFSIWHALKYAADHWSVTPEYVVLIGDDSVKVQVVDSLSVKMQSVGLMPTFFYSAYIHKNTRDTTVGDTVMDYTDASYLSVAFDSVPLLHGMEIHYDSDLQKLVNSFALGRIPVKSVDECTTYINKVVRYESRGINNFTCNRIILTADDAKQGELWDPLAAIRHHQLSADNLVEKCLKGCFLDKTYLSSFPRSPSGTHDKAKVHFFDAINKGAHCAVYFGHGHPDSLSDEGFLRASDANLFSNDSLPPMFFSFSCSNGEYLRKTIPQMCKTFLLKPKGGCIAYIAATVNTFAVANERFGSAIFSHLDSSGSISIGKTLTNAYVATWDISNFYYGVLGDPALKFTREQIKSHSALTTKQNGDITIETKIVLSAISPLNYHYQISSRDSVTCIDGISPKYLNDSILMSFDGITSDEQIIVTIPKSAITEKTCYTLYAWNGLSELRLDTVVYASSMKAAKNLLPIQTRLFSFNKGILTIVLPELSHSGEISIALYSVNGTLIKTLKTPVTANRIVADLRNAHLPAGNYIFKLTTQGQQIRGMFCNIQM